MTVKRRERERRNGKKWWQRENPHTKLNHANFVEQFAYLVIEFLSVSVDNCAWSFLRCGIQ